MIEQWKIEHTARVRKEKAKLVAADALAEASKRALKDDSLITLFNAVDDYLYGQVVGGGYPEGHTNVEHLPTLRTAFLDASNPPGGAPEIILEEALRQYEEATGPADAEEVGS